MNILHICNDFNGSAVHAHLYRELERLCVDQSVFIPTRDASVVGRNEFVSDTVKYIYADVIRPYHKLLYYAKRRRLYRCLAEVNGTFDILHASTLFSDGGLAYKYMKEFHIPYMVTVRGTDVNEFLKWMPHTWMSGWRILMNAKKIIFVSEALKRRFLSSWVVRPILSRIKDKIICIPNGVDDYWLDSIYGQVRSNHKALFIGDNRRLKNIDRLVSAAQQLRRRSSLSDLTLTLVGRIDAEKYKRYDFVTCLGPIYDRNELRRAMMEHSVFAMPSLRETFGLVYVEALSQNLALLYTKGQGIDGLFENAGEAVDARSVQDIGDKLARLFERREDYSNEGARFERFRWKNIGASYYELYNSLL